MILSISLTITTNSEANEERPEKELLEPKAQFVTSCGGEIDMAYDKEGAVQISHLVTDYHLLWSYSLSLEKEIESLKRDLLFSERNIILWKIKSDNEKNRGNLYFDLYEKRNKKALKLARKDKLKWIPWAIIAAKTIALALTITITATSSSR